MEQDVKKKMSRKLYRPVNNFIQPTKLEFLLLREKNAFFSYSKPEDPNSPHSVIVV